MEENQTSKILYDIDEGKYYTNESLIKGIINNHINTSDGRFDSDYIYDKNGKVVMNEQYVIGRGKRAEVIRALGFSDHPSKAECDAAMTTINIEAYPGKRITVHKRLVDEVQAIFKLLKQAGVELNEYIGGYCFRAINNPTKKGSKTLSMHSFGCAIDINFNLNGFVAHGKPWTSGDDTKIGKIRTVNSPIVKAFAQYGWGWGGRYGDYMHFSKANGG